MTSNRDISSFPKHLGEVRSQKRHDSHNQIIFVVKPSVNLIWKLHVAEIDFMNTDVFPNSFFQFQIKCKINWQKLVTKKFLVAVKWSNHRLTRHVIINNSQFQLLDSKIWNWRWYHLMRWRWASSFGTTFCLVICGLRIPVPPIRRYGSPFGFFLVGRSFSFLIFSFIRSTRAIFPVFFSGIVRGSDLIAASRFYDFRSLLVDIVSCPHPSGLARFNSVQVFQRS